MSTRKVKKIMIAFLLVMMLVVSSALMVSAATSSKYYSAGSSGFTAKISSETNGVSNTVVIASFSAVNSTGVSTSTSKNFSGRIAYGYLDSVSVYGVSIPVRTRNIARQTWNSPLGCQSWWADTYQ